MSSQGPTSPGTGADSSEVGTLAWSNPSRVTAADGSEASVSFAGSDTSHYLKAADFGFSIPSGATIDGIIVEWKRRASPTNVSDSSVRLVVGGTVSGDDQSIGDFWPLAADYTSFGGVADTWGLSLSTADVNGSTFGAVLSGACGGDPADGFVDHCRITVYYTGGGGTLDPATGFPWPQQSERVRKGKMRVTSYGNTRGVN